MRAFATSTTPKINSFELAESSAGTLQPFSATLLDEGADAAFRGATGSSTWPPCSLFLTRRIP